MEGNMSEALQYKLALRGSRLENFEKALGNYKYPMTNIFKSSNSNNSLALRDKDPPIIIAGFSFETSEVSGALKGATALEESYLLKQAALRFDEDGLTSSEGSSVFREGSPEMDDDYLIGQAFSLDGCEEDYFEKYSCSPEMNCKYEDINNCSNSRNNSSSRKSSREEEELYEPEVEIFEMEL